MSKRAVTLCGTCRFFDTKEGRAGGTCRRYPPRINVITIPATGQLDWSQDRPHMDVDDWCGEWRADEADHEGR